MGISFLTGAERRQTTSSLERRYISLTVFYNWGKKKKYKERNSHAFKKRNERVLLIEDFLLLLLDPTGDATAILTLSSKPREGLAVCRARAVLSFLSYFKTLTMGIGLATRIENSLLCVAGRLGRGKKARGARWEGKREDCYFHWYTVKFRKKPRDLNFWKALFEGLIFGGAYIRRCLSTDGNFRFKIDWASLIVGGKFTVFALF